MEQFEASRMLLWVLRRQNTTANISVGSIYNLALEEIPAVLLVNHFFRALRFCFLTITLICPDFIWTTKSVKCHVLQFTYLVESQKNSAIQTLRIEKVDF